MHHLARTVCALALSLPTTSVLRGAVPSGEWPEYRGPQRDGSTSASFGKPWSATGPTAVWKQPATKGFSSITVSGSTAATLMTRDHEGSALEHVVVWDAATGKEQWAAPLAVAKYQGGGDSGEEGNKGGDGPRSTPTIYKGKIYVYGASMDLWCFEAKSGKVSWKKDVAKEYGGKNIAWQNATSPIIENEMVIVSGGGEGAAFLAFNAADGGLKWKSGTDVYTHATPVAATLSGVKQVIFFMKSGLVAVDIKNGQELWNQPFKFSVSTAASPIVDGSLVYCSAGYGVGAGAYEISKTGTTWKSTEVWRKEGNDLANHWSTPVLKNGMLYGMFQFKSYGKGAVKCVEMKTGAVKWEQPGFGPGNVILSGDKILALSDKGELVMVQATPSEYKELARADVLEGKCWSTPTLAGGKIYARSTTEAGAFAVTP